MPQITVVDQSGNERTIDAPLGRSLMEAIRDAGFDELLALCGGCGSCATCHVHIDPEHFDGLPAMAPDEDDLLESSGHRTPYSRLSCQVPVSDAIEGMTVTLAEED